MRSNSFRLLNALSKTSIRPAARAFSTSRLNAEKLRIGFVPEHFSTPLHYAQEKFGLSEHATLQAFPAGTGTMVDAFHAGELDVGIGLTEAWIVGLSNSTTTEKPYHMVGAYTLSPLLWAINTGALRSDVEFVEELKGLRPGISRFGSGSHIMASVLAQKHEWLKQSGEAPFDFVECGPFDDLAAAVNDGRADFFLWEHFTSKQYYDNGTIKRIGEIMTPWNAWHIAAAGDKAHAQVAEVLLPALDKGIEKFQEGKEDAVDFISRHMAYSKEDASLWYDEVKFGGKMDIRNLDGAEIEKAIDILRTARVLGEGTINSWKDLAASDAEKYS